MTRETTRRRVDDESRRMPARPTDSVDELCRRASLPRARRSMNRARPTETTDRTTDRVSRKNTSHGLESTLSIGPKPVECTTMTIHTTTSQCEVHMVRENTPYVRMRSPVLQNTHTCLSLTSPEPPRTHETPCHPSRVSLSTGLERRVTTRRVKGLGCVMIPMR